MAVEIERIGFEALGESWYPLVRAAYHPDYPGMGEMYGGVVTADDKIGQMIAWGAGIDAWTAREGGELVALLTARVDGERLLVYDFFVAPDRQRQGIGRSLLAAALAAPGIREATAEINLDNDASLALFERFGFQPVRRVGWFVRMKSGDGETG